MRTLLITTAAAMLMATPALADRWTPAGCYELYEAGKSSHGTQYRVRACKFDASKFWEQFSPDSSTYSDNGRGGVSYSGRE
jgi:hypothetical protein